MIQHSPNSGYFSSPTNEIRFLVDETGNRRLQQKHDCFNGSIKWKEWFDVKEVQK